MSWLTSLLPIAKVIAPKILSPIWHAATDWLGKKTGQEEAVQKVSDQVGNYLTEKTGVQINPRGDVDINRLIAELENSRNTIQQQNQRINSLQDNLKEYWNQREAQFEPRRIYREDEQAEFAPLRTTPQYSNGNLAGDYISNGGGYHDGGGSSMDYRMNKWSNPNHSAILPY